MIGNPSCRFLQGSGRVLSSFVVLLVVFALPATAHAHTTMKGMGDFVAGLVHPIMTPPHLLLLLGLGLLVGQQLPLNLKTPLAVFVPASAIALMFSVTGLIRSVYPPIQIGLVLVVAILVALEKRISPLACRALFALAALVLGFDSTIEAGSSVSVAKTLLGTWIMFILLVGYVAYYASLAAANRKWLRIGIRVLGSWIIAISLLVLAFSLRPQSRPGQTLAPSK